MTRLHFPDFPDLSFNVETTTGVSQKPTTHSSTRAPQALYWIKGNQKMPRAYAPCHLEGANHSTGTVRRG